MVNNNNTVRPNVNNTINTEGLSPADIIRARNLQKKTSANSTVQKPVKQAVDKIELERRVKERTQEELRRQKEARIKEQEKLYREEARKKLEKQKEAERIKQQKLKEKELQKKAYKVVKSKKSKYVKTNNRLAKKGVSKLKVRKTISAILTFIMLGVGGYAVYKTGLIQDLYSNYQTQKFLDDAANNSNNVEQPEVILDTTDNTSDLVPQEEEIEEVVEEKHEVINTDMYDEGYEFNPKYTPEFLQSINPMLSDNTAWLEIPGTSISYAFVHPSTENIDEVPGIRAEVDKSGLSDWDFMTGYFLHRDITLNNSGRGTLFLDINNNSLSNHMEDLTDVNTIYGHHMADGSMFQKLMHWKTDNNGTYNAQHPFALIYTDDGYAYKVTFIASRIFSGTDSTPLRNCNFSSYEEKCAYIQDMIDEAHENGWFALDDYEVQPDDKFMNFVTCTYEYTNARYQLIGVMQKIKVRDTSLTDDENGYYVEENSATLNR